MQLNTQIIKKLLKIVKQSIKKILTKSINYMIKTNRLNLLNILFIIINIKIV